MDSHHRTQLELTTTAHPGESLLEYLSFHEWSQRELARRTGLTPKTVSEICNGKAPISPKTALALEKVFGRPAHFWLNLQRNFSEAMARRRELSRAFDWNQWAQNFPIKEMKRLRFSLPVGGSEADALLGFFAVASPESWQSIWTSCSVAYRQTRKFRTNAESISAWVRETELVAKDLEVAPFDEHRLISSIEDLRNLTRRRVEETPKLVQNLCAAAGVAVVWVPELRHTSISGCARWLSDTRALIGLTLRYKTDDQMWFTLFHEIGHLLLHRHKKSFVIDNAATDLSDNVIDPEMRSLEMEANRFAADALIPPERFEEFVRQESFTNESIHDFSEHLGVGPGIVVGRLQFDGILARHQGNSLKQKLDWDFKEEG